MSTASSQSDSELSRPVISNNEQLWKAVHMHPKCILCKLVSLNGPNVSLLNLFVVYFMTLFQ